MFLADAGKATLWSVSSPTWSHAVNVAAIKATMGRRKGFTDFLKNDDMVATADQAPIQV